MSRQRMGGLLRTLLARSGTLSSAPGVQGASLAAIAAAVLRLEACSPSLVRASFPQQLWQQQLRCYSEDLHTGLITNLSEAEYHKIADHTLESMLERIETFVEDLDLGDVEYSQGVMTIKLGSLGTYVINKQTPNRQIWMSSPVSGPVRYDFIDGQWVYHRDGHSLRERLQHELQKLTGGELHLEPESR